jgi:hypothetical protein
VWPMACVQVGTHTPSLQLLPTPPSKMVLKSQRAYENTPQLSTPQDPLRWVGGSSLQGRVLAVERWHQTPPHTPNPAGQLLQPPPTHRAMSLLLLPQHTRKCSDSNTSA